MASQISERQKKAVLANLRAGYIYVVIPFLILAFVKLYHEEDWRAIFLAADWSLASCIIFGQISANLSKAVAYRGDSINPDVFGYYVARRFLGVVTALVMYIFMLLEPNIYLGLAQLVVFGWATFRYFTDGVTTTVLKTEA